MLDHLGAKGTHRRVLLAGIAVWHQDADAQARLTRSQCEALAMVAAGGRDQPAHLRLAAQQCVDIDQPAAHLEGRSGSVVLVLDPQLATGALAQQWPAQLWCGRHMAMNQLRALAQLGEVEHGAYSGWR